MKNKFSKKLVLVILLLTLIFTINIHSFAEEDSTNATIESFQQVLYFIKNYYVEDISVEQLIQGAINGVVEELDPYSSHMSPDEYEEMQFEFEGHFGGVGIIVTIRNKELTIISPIKGTPGDKAGLQSGDVIYAINDELTSEISYKKAVDMMRGEPGTDVELEIKREDVEELLKIKITREDIEVPYVESEMKTDNIGHIMIAEFVKDVGKKVENAVGNLQKEGAQAIILDLRSNGGGLLTEAINVASCFIEEGKIVTIKKRNMANEVLYCEEGIKATDLPIVVLINNGSASASEIVAGAIRDYDRGKLIGTRTFGKGTVQRIIPLNNKSALRLTIARYLTPDNNFIHEKGIEPDIEVDYDPEAEEDEQIEKAIDFIESEILTEEVI